MTSTDAPLRIRPPLWARVFVVLFVPFWLWIWFTQRSEGADVVGWLVAAFGVALAVRMLVMGVVGTADGRLTVRNQFTTRTFDRTELADAVVDRADGRIGTGWTVWLVLRDGGRHRIQLTETPFLPGFKTLLARDAARVRTWIQAGNRPA